MLLTQSTFHSQSYPSHAHDGYSISLVTEGVHRFVIEGESLSAEAGDVRIIHPYEMHETRESTWSHINLSVETARVESIAGKMEIERPVLFAHVVLDEILNDMLHKLHLAKDASLANDRFEMLLRHLIRNHLFAYRDAEALAISEDMEAVRAYLDAHLCETDIDLESLARMAHMSKYHFLRRFKQTFGRTPHRYLQNIRVDCVRRAMRRAQPFSEAAHACGFYDQSHMIRVYRKFYGHTPGEIANQKQQ